VQGVRGGRRETGGRLMAVTRVLFLCTGNSCRSQMAEGLLRHLGGERYEAASAGTEPAGRVHPLAVETMRERGIDISHHRPKPLATFDGQQFDLLVTTCDEANEACPLYAGAKRRMHWSVPDPAEASGTDEEIRGAFRKAAELLVTRIEALVSEADANGR
jgi:arsenate reductase